MKIERLAPALTTPGVLFVLGFLSSMALAEGYETTNFGDKKVSRDDFIEALKPNPSAKTGQFQFRGLGMSGASAEKKAASLELKFEFNSYQLTPQAKATLDNLGQALTSNDLAGSNFVIEGHTDAKGTESYNLALSRQRAESVKRYLIDHYGVAAGRLKAQGLGKSALLDQNNPYSSQNRRVQIVNLQ
ncbi:MAG: OmpA family protein [Methylococcales bacterium]